MPDTDDVVESFLASLPEPRRDGARALCDVVRAAAPDLAPAVRGKALGFGFYSYRYDSGRQGESYVVGVAPTANGWSVYVDAVEGGTYLVEAATGRLGEVSVGKSCIRLRRVEDLDLDVLAQLVHRAASLRAADSPPS